MKEVEVHYGNIDEPCLEEEQYDGGNNMISDQRLILAEFKEGIINHGLYQEVHDLTKQ